MFAQQRDMRPYAREVASLLVTLLLAGLLLPPALFAYTGYLLFRCVLDGGMDGERLVVGVFLMAVALSWASWHERAHGWQSVDNIHRGAVVGTP